MPDMHPIVQKPWLHCGACGSPLLFPHKHGEEMEPGFALAECNICCVAIKVPVSALQLLAPIPMEKTEARPWPKP